MKNILYIYNPTSTRDIYLLGWVLLACALRVRVKNLKMKNPY
jgi:hypothetical protein